jgi:CRISPR-associated endonuclease/helicase Cas3
MTNTVKRAQKLFEALQERAPAAVHLSLLHAQYPLEDRQRWEVEVADKYGPQGKRPEQGIVIGTQVLEQSLDLDFDVMVSDLAPIDLMLQRAGRLHRHKRTRPEAHTRPKLWINLHDDAQPVAPPKADQRMYTEYILRRSWGAIEGREEICLPQEYRPLIEAVYDVAEHAQDSPLRAAWDKLVKQENHASQEARIRLLPPPDAGTPFSYATTQTTFEENENSAAWIVAQTRLGEESLNVIPLEVDAGYGVLPDGTRVSLRAETDIKTQFKLLRRNLRVSQYDAIQAIQSMNEPPTPLFKQSPLLKNYYLLPLTAGSAISTYGNVRLTFLLHPRLGLVIEREKK